MKPIRKLVTDYLVKKLPENITIQHTSFKEGYTPYPHISYKVCEQIADAVIPMVKAELKKIHVYQPTIKTLQFRKVNDSLYVCDVPDNYDIQVYQYLNKWHIKIPFVNIYTFETEQEAMANVQEILEQFVHSFIDHNEPA